MYWDSETAIKRLETKPRSNTNKTIKSNTEMKFQEYLRGDEARVSVQSVTVAATFGFEIISLGTYVSDWRLLWCHNKCKVYATRFCFYQTLRYFMTLLYIYVHLFLHVLWLVPFINCVHCVQPFHFLHSISIHCNASPMKANKRNKKKKSK